MLPKIQQWQTVIENMKNVVAFMVFFAFSLQAFAEKAIPFKNADGTTKWQHVANFSAIVFIAILLITAVFLIVANRRAAKANRELTDIKATLEDRVERRTASLNETTAQLLSREAYIASIVESMPLVLIGLNQNMEIIQWNHVAETSTGRPIATVLGKNLWDAYPAITLTPEQVQHVLTSKETLTIKHSQRDQYYFDITLYAVTDKDETGIVILVDDITKQMKAENKVAERDKASAMGELTSAMAYDINLPLHTILSTLENAQEQLKSDDQGEIKTYLSSAFAVAQQSGKQVSAIIQNLLQLASSHHDKKRTANVTELMDQSIVLAGDLFADASALNFNNIVITRSYMASLPMIPCIAAELQQVFVRLLRNAFYALNTAVKTKAITPSIHVEVGEFYDSLWIKVQHNGVCLTAKEQQDIFQPFFSLTADIPACPVEQRLSYSYFIITDHHRGQMAVTSDEHFGTTFNIQLPLV